MSDEPIPGLRDFMANAALSMLSNPDIYTWTVAPADIAKECYEIADAMLEERKREADREG